MHFLRKERNIKRRNHVLGLSVLELLIVLAAITIVALVAIPNSTVLLEKYRLKTTETSLLKGLEIARKEAQMRSTTVVVCPSSNGHTCRRDSNWNHGWVVFSDGNGNGTVQDIELIKAFKAPHQRINIEATGATESRAVFTATGLISDQVTLTGRFKICMQDSSASPRLVEVEPDGWVNPVRSHVEFCTAG